MYMSRFDDKDAALNSSGGVCVCVCLTHTHHYLENLE